MKLLKKEIENRFAEIGNQENNTDPIVVAKFFDPTGGGTWYATEYLPEERNFFGFVSLLGIERDINWKEQPMSKACPKAISN